MEDKTKKSLISDIETLLYAIKKDNIKIVKMINMDLSNKIKYYITNYGENIQKK